MAQFRPPHLKSAVRIVTGDVEIDKALAEIAKIGTANRIARSGLTKSIRVIVKGIKSEIPSRHKSVKKAIKGYVKFSKKKGFTEAKAGGVGKQEKPAGGRGNREGVGITGRNIHWYLMGTTRPPVGRQPKKKQVMKTASGRFLGKDVAEMPGTPAVKQGYAKSKDQAAKALRDGCHLQLEREVAKAKAKAGL